MVAADQAQRLDPELMLTPAEVALLLDLSPKTVGRWGDRGILRIHRTPGGHRRFRAKEVFEVLEHRREVGEP